MTTETPTEDQPIPQTERSEEETERRYRNEDGVVVFLIDAKRQSTEGNWTHLYYADGNIFARINSQHLTTNQIMIFTSIVRVVHENHNSHLAESYDRPGVLRHFHDKQEKDRVKFGRLKAAIHDDLDTQLQLFADGYPYELTTMRAYIHKYARNYITDAE